MPQWATPRNGGRLNFARRRANELRGKLDFKLGTQGQESREGIPSGATPPVSTPTSPWQALSAAFGDTLQLLFNPFIGRRWIKLSLICLVLGGGTSSAAFQWSFGSLRYDPSFRELLNQAWTYIGQNLWLVALLTALSIGLILILLYFRAMCRFMLVDAVLRQRVGLVAAWRTVGPLGRSYFLWLLGFLLLLGGIITGLAIVAFPTLRAFATAATPPIAAWMVLIGILVIGMLVSLLIALLVILTDDLVVPTMYAERVSLPAAWRKLWVCLRAEVATFAGYILMRLAVSVGTGLAALFFLFPSLVGFFSGSVIVVVLFVGALRVVGVMWAWNPFTIGLAGLALLVLTALLLILLSVVGMPALVLLQSLGIRFIGSRVPAVEATRTLLNPTGR